MKTYISIAFLSVSLLALQSCKEEEHAHNHVTLAISQPLDGDSIQGSSVAFQALVIGTEDLHGWQLRFVNAATSVELFETDDHAHNDTLTVNYSWSHGLTQPTSILGIFTAVIDHDGNTEVDSVAFTVIP